MKAADRIEPPCTHIFTPDCPYLRGLNRWKAWRARTKAVCSDPIWSPNTFVAAIDDDGPILDRQDEEIGDYL